MEAHIAAIRRHEVNAGVDLDAGLEAIAGDILPGDRAECRRRRRLYALRAMERLGLLGGELLPTLSRRPDLRWLADEHGARVDVLTELGRIRDPETFEAAVAWVLEQRPRTGEARARLRLVRAGSGGPDGTLDWPPRQT